MWITSWTPTIFFLYHAQIQSDNIYFFEKFRMGSSYLKKIKTSLALKMYGTIDTLWFIEAIVSIFMKVLRWSRTISHLFLRICYIVDDIVHFIWMRGCINNYPHPVCGIVRYQLKEKKHISTWSPCFQYTLSTCQQAFSINHKIQFIYFPIYLLLEACAHDLRFALPESTTAQASNVARVRSQKAPEFQLLWFMLNRCTHLRFAFLFHSKL